MKHLNELVEYMQSTRFNRMKALEMAEDLQKRTCSNCKHFTPSRWILTDTCSNRDRVSPDFFCDSHTMQQ